MGEPMTELAKKSADKLQQLFVADHLAALEAYRGKDIPKHNHWFNRASAAADALLTRGDEGRAVLAELLRHSSPTIRLNAAVYVKKWAPNEAIPVIERVMLWADDDRTERLFGESMNVATSSKMLLAEHYHLNILDVRNFIREKHGLPPKERSREAL
jgi:HEAT repeat protein